MNVTILMVTSQPAGMNSTAGYVIGIIIALFLLGFLLYSLVKPENF